MTLSDLDVRHQDERRALVLRTLKRTDGRVAPAAKALGIQRTYLYALITKLGLEVSNAPR